MYMDTEEALEALSERLDYLEHKFGSLVAQLKRNGTIRSKDEKKANQEVREKMRQYAIPQWRLADATLQNENNINKMLRVEMSEEKKRQVLGVLERLHIEDLRLANAMAEESINGGEVR